MDRPTTGLLPASLVSTEERCSGCEISFHWHRYFGLGATVQSSSTSTTTDTRVRSDTVTTLASSRVPLPRIFVAERSS